ncbi:helix-turn-helix domain-containing protein [Paludisphaera rhizosphaerae]|uniref:helix-turn-helix domain-containing protein n=1 Tax=Paludisphaera rhizosphaerae TaxID=2711216 RepID=UPI0013EA6B5E|nr:transcriptional regulator [Paludisphaera rhizosphaerae]
MNKYDGLTPLGAEMAADMDAFLEALEAGEPIGRKFTVRTLKLELEPREYAPEDVKAVRRKLGASQPLLAKFLGVSVKTLRAWEQGLHPVPAIAARFLDEIQAAPEIWTRRIEAAAK